MCKVFDVSRSGFYKWLNSPPSPRSVENEELSELIKKYYLESKKRYGAPRITAILHKHGYKVSRQRVARLMQKMGIRCVYRKKFVVTTKSKHAYKVSDNLVNRQFDVERPGQIWVSDITYIKVKEGWRYLTAVMDLADRKVIGWSISDSMQAQKTVIPALQMALINRPLNEQLIFHSDRGIQYACDEFRKLLKAYPRIKQSMSRKGDCWDNAVMESFFKTLKVECVYQHKNLQSWNIRQELFEFIEIWYNRQRLHSALGYKTPAQVEEEMYYQLYYAA